MVRDSAATRSRILDAAIAEFAEYGLAGGRIDRIAEAAGANKRSIYVYFENKELLFSATLHRVISQMTEAVPLTGDDLPDYAARLFDYVMEHRDALRLVLWRKLERPAAGPDEAAIYAEKIRTVTMPGTDAKAEHGGLPPTDMLILVQVMASAWLTSPDDLLAADGSDPHSPERLAIHRAAIVEAVTRMTRPAT